jgi:glutamate 5-kinase
LDNKVVHTRFTPTKKASGKKKWLAHSENAATGVVQINEGAKTVLISSKASSLLPVGIISIVSDFKKGEIIKIIDEHNKTIGLGLAEYGSDKARELTGQKNQKALVHYDYLYLQG